MAEAQENRSSFKFQDLLFITVNAENEKRRNIIAALVASLLIATISTRLLLVILLLWAFVGGYYLASWLLEGDFSFPSFIRGHVDKSKLRVVDEFSLVKLHCPVCGKDLCKRHRPELNIFAFQPWTGLKIPAKVDAALEEFLGLVLNKFIYSWYSGISKDEAFVNEIRSHFRFIASVLLRRAQKVDLPTFFCTVLTKAYLRHLHYYLEIRRKGRRGVSADEAMLEAYGPSLHPALYSRKAELAYLSSITDRLFPYLLPLQSLQCRSFCTLLREITACAVLQPAMDVFANPDFLNRVLALMLEKGSTPVSDLLSPRVSILGQFAQITSMSNSCLQLGLPAILGSQELLFQFMQFLKLEASVNVLQFYLSVDDLNSRILKPELTERQLKQLHQDLCVLYQMYCEPSAIDHIQLDDDIVSQLKQVCEGPPEGVLLLQKTTPLFRAHDHVYRLLETTFLPLFHQSDVYYQMLCGDQFGNQKQSNNRLSKKTGDANSLSRIGSRLKGVFKNNAIDGKVPDDMDVGQECDPLAQADDGLLTSGIPSSPVKLTGDRQPLHNLSAWRVSIPSVVQRPDPDNPRKVIYVFLVEVWRLDVSEEDFETPNWTAERLYNEFYVLEQKLKEFHGDIEDCHLPPKKPFSTRLKKEILLSVKPDFEAYLQKLLTIPFLQSSELLYRFLNSEEEFMAEINLGKIMKSGALKLVKERGQHLDLFLQTMATSVDSPKGKKYLWAHKDSASIVSLVDKMSHSIYGDNAMSLMSISDMPDPSLPAETVSPVPVNDLWEAGLFLAHHVFCAPRWLLNTLTTIGIVVRHTYDEYMKTFFAERLNDAFHEDRLVRVISLLQEAVFAENKKTKTAEDLLRHRRRALTVLRAFIPGIAEHAVGGERLADGTELMLDSLQHPVANKQLSYILLDELLRELVPELVQTSSTQQPASVVELMS